MLRVYPVTGKRFACIAFALSYFVLVMGKDIVDAAGMDVKMRAKILHGHGAALDMPAGETTPPGAIPCHLAIRFGHFPQGEIFRITTVGNDPFAHPRQHIFNLLPVNLTLLE